MSKLFTPGKIGNVELPNRFVHSATHEGMAKESGEVSDELIRRYQKLAKGGVGLAITGLMCIHPSGRGYRCETAIQNGYRDAGNKVSKSSPGTVGAIGHA